MVLEGSYAHGSKAESGVPDMTSISDIDEFVINQNLRVRYGKDQIYTYTGTILVAVNPYKELEIYTPEYVFRYHGAKMGALDPHIFAMAEAAHTSLKISDRNQSCVISGESGAGKTETTKFILQYLCSVTSNVSTWVEHQILEANTILEAFGNAKTVRNDNSSRFGKFMQVCFDSKWMIKGCIIQDYLLEQSRITFQSPGERNYHVFYHLLEGAKDNPELTKQFHLKPPGFYKYLNQSGCVQIEGVSDNKKLDALRLAFNVVQVPPQMVDGIFAVIAAILWLGNLEFEDIDGEKCKLTEEDKTMLLIVADLLGLQEEDLVQVALLRQINVRGNITEIPLKLQEARENRHAMAKALYSRTFAWLVNHINTCTNPGQDSSRFLGVLDIFGFENFDLNSFEQLCINYTNEKLHKFFNHYVFALEQEIYRQEEIEFSHIQFTDNTSCLELIEKPPRCILKLLTEQCHMPKGSDIAYLNNLHSEFENHPQYVKGDDRRKWETEFGIKHYAGAVTYAVQGFVDKNRDVQQDVFFDFMSRSTNEFIQEITVYQDLLGSTVAKMGATMARGTTKGKPTVSDTFRYQLQALVDVLQATNPWYVRCIKPNMEKAANNYNEKLVLDQLKYLGMLEIIRIRKEGYPVHMSFTDFIQRFKCLSQLRLPLCQKDAVRAIIQTHNIFQSDWQIGNTKVFLKGRAYEPLEDSRQKILQTCSLLIQRVWRGYHVRKDYKRIRNATLRVQHAYRGWKQRLQFIKMRRAAIVIQSHLRGVFAREVAAALREMRRVEEEMRKRERLEEERRLRELEEEERRKNSVEEMERVAQEQIAALSQIAEQINPKLMSTDHVGESVDLDNLFAFLSEMQPGSRHNIIEEISSHMDDLVEDLDVELESVIQQELEGLNGVPPNGLDTRLRKQPSLPEPTMPPPPPPTVTVNGNGTKTPTVNTSEVATDTANEPIYESVIPREDGSNSPPPLPTPPHKLRPKSPGVDRIQRNTTERSTSPRPRQPGSPQCGSRPSSRGSSTGVQTWRYYRNDDDPEKEQRRKFRVEKKLQELEEEDKEREKESNLMDDPYHDIVEFAHNYFNSHERSPEGTIIATLTRKPKTMEVMPKYEMVTYYKGNSIPNSHIHMYDPDNVNIACAIFRDLCKYLRGDLKPDAELATIQAIVGHGIEREELRDEIYVQCIRQVTNCPQPEWCERIWLLLCLCIVAFQPSKLLYKYFVCFLKKNLSLDGKLRQYVQWCLDNCNNNRVSNRLLPPSSVEVSAMRRLGTIVCRFFFLDGRTKAIDVHPTDTAADAVVKLGGKLGLPDIEGWAIYQSGPDGEEHVKAHDYLYDIIAAWEQKQNKLETNHSSFTSLSRRGNQASLNSGDNRFIFKKRLFRNSRELSQDPVEVHMLYAQAVHSVVKCDDYPVSEKVALQLAGLQAQVALGEPSANNNNLNSYANIDAYLPYRISKSRGDDVWMNILRQAHRQYGTGRSEVTAKALYLSCVMQYPLYGTTMYPVTYRGYWSYGNSLTLGINCDGLMLIKPDDKFVLYEYRYQDIESIFLDPTDNLITVNLMRHLPENSHKCFVFETAHKNEIGSLIVSYCPALASWIIENEAAVKKVKAITNEDRIRLYHNLMNSRRNLVESDLLRKPQDAGGGFIRNTLRRLSKHRLEKLRAEYAGEEGVKGFPSSFWAFTRQPLLQSLSKIPETEEQLALQVFQIILTYAGLGQNGDSVRRADDEHISLIQTIMTRCMQNDALLTELYLQLIKQTTDHPDPNSRVNLRHWALLSLACSVVLPPHKQLRKYLIAHLKRCASDCVTEEGKYARFAEKCLYRTQGTPRRQWPPSREEIMCTINRRPIYARFYLMDGQYHAVEFQPSSTSKEVMDVIKSKIGLRESAMGYAIYEVLGGTERSLVPEEKVADVMSKWEKYRTNNTQQAGNSGTMQAKNTRKQQHFFLFKKHLFLDQYMDLDDPVEKELLYHQVLHGLRCDRFPISEKEAVMLTALQAQLELGDCGNVLLDYKSVASHCLAGRFVPHIPHECVAMHHQSLRGMSQPEAKKSFLNLIQSWPLHRATIFDVMQSFTSNWPRVLWLAVDQVGLHLLEYRSRNALVTYDYESVQSYTPALNYLMIVTGSVKKQSKVILATAQAFQIANLIREYCEVLQAGCENKGLIRRDGQMSQEQRMSTRPMSILHKPTPVIEQAAS